MSEPLLVEYRVVPVTRYEVTRYEDRGPGAASVCGKGEFGNADIAHQVAYALAKDEHGRLGWPIDDPRIQYPKYEPSGSLCQQAEVPREVTSQEFSVPVAAVLDGAKDLIEVAVIGIEGDGAISVASSMGTPQTIALFAQAKTRIAEISAE